MEEDSNTADLCRNSNDAFHVVKLLTPLNYSWRWSLAKFEDFKNRILNLEASTAFCCSVWCHVLLHKDTKHQKDVRNKTGKSNLKKIGVRTNGKLLADTQFCCLWKPLAQMQKKFSGTGKKIPGWEVGSMWLKAARLPQFALLCEQFHQQDLS